LNGSTVKVEDQAGGIELLPTIVGGKIVYATGPDAQWDEKHETAKSLGKPWSALFA
jgi:hypothetical protein